MYVDKNVYTDTKGKQVIHHIVNAGNAGKRECFARLGKCLLKNIDMTGRRVPLSGFSLGRGDIGDVPTLLPTLRRRRGRR